MKKSFFYHDLEVTVDPDKPVILEVKLISDGNISSTSVALHDVVKPPPIMNSGTKTLAEKGSQVKGQVIDISTALSNPKAEEDTITIQYLINGTLVKEHSNPKSEGDQIDISLDIKLI